MVTVEITEDDIYTADASHLNGQSIAKHIKRMLRGSGGHYDPEDWRRDLLKACKVTACK